MDRDEHGVRLEEVRASVQDSTVEPLTDSGIEGLDTAMYMVLHFGLRFDQLNATAIEKSWRRMDTVLMPSEEAEARRGRCQFSMKTPS